MEPSVINVLLLEDNKGDMRLLEHTLDQVDAPRFRLAWCEDLDSGLEALRRLLAAMPLAPAVIVLSGTRDEQLATQAAQAGAQDYLIKGQVDAPLLVRAIRYAMERRHAEFALRQVNEELERRAELRTVELARTVLALEAEVAERTQAEERIRRMVHYDALTGLPNRVLLKDRLDQAISHAHRSGGRVAVLFVDLDYFKNINDSLGHHVGGQLLQMAAARLQMCMREDDSVAPLGGNEFVICLPMLEDSTDAARVARKVLDALEQAFTVEGHHLHVSASVGIFPEDGSDVEALMRTADTAMYHAKEMGAATSSSSSPHSTTRSSNACWPPPACARRSRARNILN